MAESRTKQQTRKLIQNTFLHLLSETGLHKITVASVTKAAGINRSTFYEYYSDVRALLEDTENKLLADLDTGFQAACENFTKDNLDEIFASAVHLMQSHGDTLYILLGANGDPNFSMKVIETVKPHILTTFQMKKFPAQLDTVVTFAMSGLIGVFTSWYAGGRQESLEDVIHTMQKILYAIVHDVFC